MATVQPLPNAGEILTRSAALFRSVPLPGVAWLVALTGASMAIDLMDAQYQALNYLISIASVVAQYKVIQLLLEREGMMREPRPAGRVGAFIGAGIVTGFAIAFGFLVLVLPGLYLFARWSIVDPLILGDGMGMSEAMSESWKRTGPFALHIALAFGILYLPWAVGLAMLFLAVGDGGTTPISPMTSALSNLLLYFSMVASWYAMVAVAGYVWKHEDLGDIFA